MIPVYAVENVYLDQMQYAGGANTTSKQECLPGTRTSVLDEITNWVNLPNTENVPRVFWLHGVAGSGKSALALTICDRFNSVNRLVSAFFFDKAVTDRTPAKLFSTISRDLADLVPEWRDALTEILRGKKALRTTMAVKEQWNRFILDPARKLAESTTTARRILIVIDAVDEAGKSLDRDVMLSMFEDLGRLPSIFRVFITSRPDDDIYAALSGKGLVIAKDMARIDLQSTFNDINSYVHHHLPSLDDATVHSLVEKAAGHFQWVATACRFIIGKEVSREVIQEYQWAGGMSRETQFNQKRLDHVLVSAHTYGLDGLYTSILKECFPYGADNQGFLSRFRAVLGRVLYSRIPLTLAALADLRRDNEEPLDTLRFLQPLSSLFQGVSAESDLPVQALHTSLQDYLTTSHRSGQFCIPLDPQHDHHLGLACLHTMKSLQFNMCHLESSYLRNDQVLDLSDRVQRYIPHALAYACRFWTHHIISVPVSSSLLAQLLTILEEKSLFWLEILSLMKVVGSVLVHLDQLQGFVKVREPFTLLFRC